MRCDHRMIAVGKLSFPPHRAPGAYFLVGDKQTLENSVERNLPTWGLEQSGYGRVEFP